MIMGIISCGFRDFSVCDFHYFIFDFQHDYTETEL